MTVRKFGCADDLPMLAEDCGTCGQVGRVAEVRPAPQCFLSYVGGRDWARLGRLVHRERLRRSQSQAEFAASIGISVRTLGSIEQAGAENYDDNTRAAIEDAMSWEAGSIEHVIYGRRPVTNDRDLFEIQRVWSQLTADQRQLLAIVAVEAARRR